MLVVLFNCFPEAVPEPAFSALPGLLEGDSTGINGCGFVDVELFHGFDLFVMVRYEA